MPELETRRRALTSPRPSGVGTWLRHPVQGRGDRPTVPGPAGSDGARDHVGQRAGQDRQGRGKAPYRPFLYGDWAVAAAGETLRYLVCYDHLNPPQATRLQPRWLGGFLRKGFSPFR